MSGVAGGSGPQPTRTRWSLVVLAIAVVLLGSGLGVLVLDRSSGPSPTRPGAASAGPARIELLPSIGTRSGCIVGRPGLPRPTFGLDNGTFQANTYDVPTGTNGSVGMCYDGATGSMLGYANWSHVGATGWFSYPSVVYGVNAWAGAYSSFTNESPAWPVPQAVSSIVNGSLWVVTNFTFHAPNASDVDGYDFSLDDFFTDSESPEFEVGPFVEVMVWFAHHITYPDRFAAFDAPTLVNATVENEPWSVGDWCHGVDNGTNDNVSFDFSYGGQASGGLPSGTIGVNLSLLLVEVERMMPSTACWEGPAGKFSTFYLDETNLGSEDGALGGRSFDYNWTVRSYCFLPRVASPSASHLACPPGGAAPPTASLSEPPFPPARERPSGATVAAAVAVRASPRGRSWR